MQPTGPDHDRWADAAAAYLLGALDPDEVGGYEAHLAGCAACREELDELAPAAHALPASVDPVAPPPELKGRIMAEVEREASLLAAAGERADRPERRRRFALPSLLPALAAAAALLLLGAFAGFAGDRLLRDGGGRTTTASVDAPGARAQLTVEDGAATLVARDLPAPPEGRVYQVWTQRAGGRPEPTTALFMPDRDGAAATTVPGTLDRVERVIVTDEPPGGSRAPTGATLLVAQTS